MTDLSLYVAAAATAALLVALLRWVYESDTTHGD